ncbi:MAG: hypothetical protein KGH59_00945 [Candidatus Micrarchaeota archaeon]|nr:hypothetical protein [Candidatus Micrarchaeota archaeon]MDE1804338.1 hypothetical protein [Candidatus Micrarchaeota archaeon]MDE1846557.1 hypothetical protein [Candidatus Micrarchaeota archaeon]
MGDKTVVLQYGDTPKQTLDRCIRVAMRLSDMGLPITDFTSIVRLEGSRIMIPKQADDSDKILASACELAFHNDNMLQKLS